QRGRLGDGHPDRDIGPGTYAGDRLLRGHSLRFVLGLRHRIHSSARMIGTSRASAAIPKATDPARARRQPAMTRNRISLKTVLNSVGAARARATDFRGRVPTG